VATVKRLNVVSIPEKTIEHWMSQYLTYRFRTKAQLWWPAFGEDVNVLSMLRGPGKVIQLEVKTTTVTREGRHILNVDLGQLWEYLQRNTWEQPFYVFPLPDWPGVFKKDALAAGMLPADCAYQRTQEWWFGHTMAVMPAQCVADLVADELKGYQHGTQAGTARLADIEVSRNSWDRAVTWAPRRLPTSAAAPAAKFWWWTDFWKKLVACGEPDWPQVIRVRRAAVGAGPWHPHDELVAALRYRRTLLDGLLEDDLLTFGGGADRGFVLLDDDLAFRAPDGRHDETEHRAIVAIPSTS
jgi:hypothetical protein